MTGQARFGVLIPFLGALTALGPLSVDLYVPSLSLVASGLGVGGGDVQLTVSSLLLGYSAGSLIYGPLSDRFGRKPLLCAGLAVYVLAGALAAASQELAALVGWRALQGLGASSGMVLARAIILDRWTGEQASKALSWVASFTFLTPVLAPALGGYVASFGHWPAVLWMQAGAGALCLAVTASMLPRARRAGTASLLESVKAYGAILRDGEAIGYMLCTGAGFIGVVAFVTSSSFVLVDLFGLRPREYGLCFSLVMLGASGGAYVNGRLVARAGISRMIGFGTAILAAGGTLALLAGVLGAGLPALLGAAAVYVFGIGFVFANSMARTMSRFRGNAGAASALFGVNQFLIGAIVAALLSLVERPSPLPLTGAMGFAGLSCAAVWWGWLRRTHHARGT